MSTMNKVKNLLNVSLEEKRTFINSFDHILTDCDGTIWHLMDPIDGAGEAISKFQELGKKIVYVTNNSLRSDADYMNKFAQSKIPQATISDVMHPAYSAVHYLKERNFNGLVYAIGSPVLRQIIRDAGFDVIDGPHQFVDENFSSLWKSVHDGQTVGAVVLDTDFNLTSSKLIRAQLYLKNPNCLFIVGATDPLLAVTDGIEIIGPGPFYKILENVLMEDQKAILVGKPGQALCDILVKKFNLTKPKRVLFVGDMIEQDIGFGNMSGFQTLLVLTGGTTIERLMNTNENSALLPTYYLNSFGDMLQILEELK